MTIPFFVLGMFVFILGLFVVATIGLYAMEQETYHEFTQEK